LALDLIYAGASFVAHEIFSDLMAFERLASGQTEVGFTSREKYRKGGTYQIRFCRLDDLGLLDYLPPDVENRAHKAHGIVGEEGTDIPP
jgi:hypothetical protein